MPKSKKSFLWPWFLPVVIVVFGLLLRLPHLNSSFWLDEAAQAWESNRPWSQQFNIAEDFQPPALHILTKTALLIGSQEWWLRSWGALIPGVLTIWLVYLIGKEHFSEETGLKASLLLALNSFHIFYSQELRPYSLPTFLATLSWWLWFKLFLPKSPASSTSLKSPYLLAFGAVSILGCYTSYLYPFLLPIQFLSAWWLAPHLRRSLLSVATMIMVIFGLWLPVFSKQLSVGTSLRESLPGWENVVSLSQTKSVALVAGKFIFGVIDLDVSMAFGAITALLVGCSLSLLWTFFAKATAGEKQRFFILCLWAIGPLILAWIVSFIVPVIQPKRVLFLLPAWLLAASYLTSFSGATKTAKNLLTKNIGCFFLALLLVIQLHSIFQYWTQPRYQRENWRGAYQDITQKYPPADTVVLFAFPGPYPPWTWYAEDTYPNFSSGVLLLDDPQRAQELVKLADPYRYVIVFDYLRDLTDPQRLLDKELEEFGYQTIEIRDYPNIGFVRVYAKPFAVIGTL